MTRPLTPAQVADRWQCSERHVRHMVKSGFLKPLEFQILRFDAEVIEKIENTPYVSAKPGVVYFMDGGGLVKIGFTTDLEKRFLGLKMMSPVRVTLLGSFPGSPDDERDLHKRFAEYRMHGEWFRREGGLAEYIETLK